MADPVIYLHIGTGKTGTSSIQTALEATEKGILYPKAGRGTSIGGVDSGHHHLAWSAIRAQASERNLPLTNDPWQDVLEEIRLSTEDRVVISSEFLFLAMEEDLKRIRNFLGNHRVRVIIYLRNQWDYLLSRYKQDIKMGDTTRSLREALADQIHRVDYAAILDRWFHVFDVEVRLYDKVKSDVISDFEAAIGSTLRRPPRRLNITPRDGTIRLIRILNILESKSPDYFRWFLHRTRRNILGRRTPGRYLSSISDALFTSPIASDSIRAWFREYSFDTRRIFLQKYVTPKDHSLFDF